MKRGHHKHSSPVSFGSGSDRIVSSDYHNTGSQSVSKDTNDSESSTGSAGGDSGKPEELPLHLKILKAGGVTALGLLLSLILTTPFSASVSGIFSTPERGDFRMTDLYAQVADARPVRTLDDRIVIVDIGLAGREEIAEGLQTLAICGPKAVGMDINFPHPGENDSTLLEAISTFPGLVVPLGIEQKADGRFAVADKPFFYGSMPSLSYGVINLPAERENASIREYAVDYPTDGGKVPSFVMAVADIADPAAAAETRRRGNPRETIDYASRQFRTIGIDEIADNVELVNDRIVLLGALSDAADMHASPINSYVSGLMIHAYSLSSLLDRKWLTTIPAWVDYVTAGVFCFALILFAILCPVRHKWRGMMLRIFQIAVLMLAVVFGYFQYIDHALIFNFSHTLLMMAFGLFALDLWNGIEWMVGKASALKQSKRQTKCALNS